MVDAIQQRPQQPHNLFVDDYLADIIEEEEEPMEQEEDAGGEEANYAPVDYEEPLVGDELLGAAAAPLAPPTTTVERGS